PATRGSCSTHTTPVPPKATSRVVAAGLHEAYFQDGGTRADDLDAVELTDIDYVEFDIRG
ncbi:hypothetical protein GT354_41665, partial [Streptomyces sp. SID3343]|nr:hypothetical protein [Streptomyces sp. SID3343]